MLFSFFRNLFHDLIKGKQVSIIIADDFFVVPLVCQTTREAIAHNTICQIQIAHTGLRHIEGCDKIVVSLRISHHILKTTEAVIQHDVWRWKSIFPHGGRCAYLVIPRKKTIICQSKIRVDLNMIALFITPAILKELSDRIRPIQSGKIINDGRVPCSLYDIRFIHRFIDIIEIADGDKAKIFVIVYDFAGKIFNILLRFEIPDYLIVDVITVADLVLDDLFAVTQLFNGTLFFTDLYHQFLDIALFG